MERRESRGKEKYVAFSDCLPPASWPAVFMHMS